MCVERPIGTTLRELMSEMGGVRGGKKLLGVIPGGASTSFLTPDHLDVPLDFEPVGQGRQPTRHRHLHRVLRGRLPGARAC